MQYLVTGSMTDWRDGREGNAGVQYVAVSTDVRSFHAGDIMLAPADEDTPMPKIHTDYLPAALRPHIHDDFKKNEQHYWQVRDTLLEQYAGRWIALNENGVVAEENGIFEILDSVARVGGHPYIARVGAEDDTVFTVRRVYEYDTSYSPFAIPRVEATFSNFARTCAKECDDVIPDTGADLTTLPIPDGRDIRLPDSPYLQSGLKGVVGPVVPTLIYRGHVQINGTSHPSLIQLAQTAERLLGRDVMNRLRVTFDGPNNEVEFEM